MAAGKIPTADNFETILEAWLSYMAETLDGVDAGPGQVEDTRNAFYAGAFSVYALLKGDGDQATRDSRTKALLTELFEWRARLERLAEMTAHRVTH